MPSEQASSRGDGSTQAIDRWANDIHCGDVVETLQAMPESSVHMAMCSPPYFGLRDYGVDGQIGLEESLDGYIQNLVDVGAELRRVLRDDGSWWLNLGDTFGGDSIVRGDADWTRPGDDGYEEAHTSSYGDGRRGMSEIGRKNKMLVPHRVAIALQEAGWVVRGDCVWAKPNPMPHPVKDRLRVDKEFIFHLTPEPDYWFDLDVIREPHKEKSVERRQRYDFNTSGTAAEAYPSDENTEYIGTEPEDALHPNGKNPGDIIEVAVKPFPEAHFAVYPPDLCETPVKSSCPETVCAECGTPYDREVLEAPLHKRDVKEVDRRQAKKALRKYQDSELTAGHIAAIKSVGFGDGDHGDAAQGSMDRVDRETQALAKEAKDVLGDYFREFVASPDKTVTGDWQQKCGCDTDETEPGIVLDPFAGAGTTCLVAKRLGRRFVGIDLNPEYVAMAQKRVGVTVDEPDRLLEDGETSLTAYADGGQP